MMHLSLCTISFRHQLVSLPELARFAFREGLDGLELWAAHARSLRDQPQLNGAWLESLGLDLSMLSGYLPICGSPVEGRRQMEELCALAYHWGARKLRIFAGPTASARLSASDYQQLVGRLRAYCQQAADAGMELLIETHPDTGADGTAATCQLLEDVNHPALGVNLDVLHIWEAREDPVAAWHRLAPHVRHMHFKNISARRYLNVFEPTNVYSAAGSREGMVPLFKGACDYTAFLQALPRDRIHCASLEWFGGNASQVIAQDTRQLRTFSHSLTLRMAH